MVYTVVKEYRLTFCIEHSKRSTSWKKVSLLFIDKMNSSLHNYPPPPSPFNKQMYMQAVPTPLSLLPIFCVNFFHCYVHRSVHFIPYLSASRSLPFFFFVHPHSSCPCASFSSLYHSLSLLPCLQLSHWGLLPQENSL